jgi:UDP-3-O-[3-hydroxymyristoyl] glucosamine N-acyltransferase
LPLVQKAKKQLMEYTAKQLAHVLNGTVEGDPKAAINSVAKIEEARSGSLSFLSNPKYKQYIYTTEATIVLVNNNFEPDTDKEIKATLIRVEDSYLALTKLLELYQQNKYNLKGVSSKAKVARSAKIGKNVYIAEFVSIADNVIIGDNVKIFPSVTIYPDAKIGEGSVIHSNAVIMDGTIMEKNVRIQSGAIIGQDGFGYAPQKDGTFLKIPHLGIVHLEDDVEIGANASVNRGTMGTTIVKKGAKIDDLCQVGHNVTVGENAIIAGQSGIAGSTKIGKNFMAGGQIGIVGHIEIGDFVKCSAKSGITKNIKDNSVLIGSPAFDAYDYRKSHIFFKNLPTLVRRLNELEAEVKRLKELNPEK